MSEATGRLSHVVGGRLQVNGFWQTGNPNKASPLEYTPP